MGSDEYEVFNPGCDVVILAFDDVADRDYAFNIADLATGSKVYAMFPDTMAVEEIDEKIRELIA